MASLIPGYEYDIFISYRQKDKKPVPGYGWQGRGETNNLICRRLQPKEFWTKVHKIVHNLPAIMRVPFDGPDDKKI